MPRRLGDVFIYGTTGLGEFLCFLLVESGSVDVVVEDRPGLLTVSCIGDHFVEHANAFVGSIDGGGDGVGSGLYGAHDGTESLTAGGLSEHDE